MARAKSYIVKKFGSAAITTGAAVQVARFDLGANPGFTITVVNTASITVNYSIQTAPVDNSAAYTAITATSVAGSAGVVKNTFTDNYSNYCRVLASATAALASGSLSIYFSTIED